MKVTAGNDETFEANDKVTVTSEGYLKKTDTTLHEGPLVVNEGGDPSKDITYKVEINPNGYKLNNGDPLTLTDYISTNMDLNPESVQIFDATMGTDGSLVAGNTSPAGLEISYNDDSRLLSIRNIPDETPLLLTYTCFARAQGEDTFKNTATLIGGGSHSSTVTEKHNIQTNDAGVKIDGIELNMFKIDENQISKKLAGAKFQLYECKLAIGDMTNPEQYNDRYWEDLLRKMDRITAGNGTPEEIAQIKEQFKIVEYVPIGEPAVTGTSGFTQWNSLNEHKLYAWIEVEAPENYSGYEGYHYFVGYQHIDVNSDQVPQPLLPKPEQDKRKHAAWALDDAAQLANDIRVASMANLTTWTATNVETKYTSISATKEWENDSDNLFQTRPTGGIRLQLWQIQDDGTKVEYGSPVAINADDEGNWPTYIWNKLPANDAENEHFTYTVTEERIENYTTSYSDNGEGIARGELKVTNRMIPKKTNISVKKVFAGDENDDKPSSIHVTLMVIKTNKEGESGEPEETSYETYLSDTNEWKWTFENLPTTTIEEQSDGTKIPYTLSYTVAEDTAALEREGFHYTVTYSDNGEGVIETTEEDPLLITNTKQKGKITVKKTFAGVTDETDLAALQDGLTVTISGKDVGGEGIDILDLTWDDVKDDGYMIDGLPLNETYTVTETISANSVLPKYTVTSETVSTANAVATVDGETAELKNVYHEIFEVTKIWKNQTNVNVDWVKDIEIILHKKPSEGDEITYTYTVTGSEGVYTASSTDEEAPAATVIGNAQSGYTIKWELLPTGFEYSVTENRVDDYKDPEYSKVVTETEGTPRIEKKGDDDPTKDRALNGEYIVNRPNDSVVLPTSGGPGTRLFYGMGISIVAMAGLLLFIKRRSIRDFSEGRW